MNLEKDRLREEKIPKKKTKRIRESDMYTSGCNQHRCQFQSVHIKSSRQSSYSATLGAPIIRVQLPYESEGNAVSSSTLMADAPGVE